ncbi:ApeP family dehydratase [Helicobacter sp. T3_23-1056]
MPNMRQTTQKKPQSTPQKTPKIMPNAQQTQQTPQKNIANFIPQSLEMVLIDSLLEVSQDFIRTQAHIKADNAFLHTDEKTGKSRFPSYNILEIFAQSLALWRTKKEQQNLSKDSKKNPNTAQNTQNANKLGFLLGARGFEIFTPFVEIGQIIQVNLTLNMQDENGLGVYEGEAFVNGKIVAKTSLTALNPNDEFLSKILDG